MKCRRAVCTKWATVVVSWSWESSRHYPSVYRFCEPCADVLCAWLERGMDCSYPVPDNLVVDHASDLRNIECHTVREAAA
jgi:hypothetical protein